MSKSEKLYKDSPSVKKDKDGKPGISRPSKADKENMGLEGNPAPGAGAEMPIDVEEQERQDMHARHEAEVKSLHDGHEKAQKDMHQRHEDDHKKMHERHKQKKESEKQTESGKAEIEKVEETKE